MHFDTLFKVLTQTDWKRTPLYEQFRDHGRWIWEGQSSIGEDANEVYSEIEVNYLSSTLH